MNYILTARLASEGGGVSETSNYEYTIDVRPLGKTGRSRVAYDAELKMYFETYVEENLYRMDIRNIYLDLPKRLKKAADFIRRTRYATDLMEVKTGASGSVKAIGNVAELHSNWEKIKHMLTGDFTGEAVTEYLAKIDRRLSPGSIAAIASCYSEYGLIFPHIPATHDENWTNVRPVELSGYDGEIFEEETRYRETVNGVRRYTIRGRLPENSSLILTRFEGYADVPENELLPRSADIRVEYRNRIIDHSWYFRLEKY